MKNKQRGYLKILLVVIPLIYTFHPSFSQTSSFRLKTADSLFRAKLYTQSFEHYEEILKQKQYTPAMLLKMAFIQEGLEHIGKSMYYLNLYFLATRDVTALDKIQELATKYNLEGYEESDTDRLLSFYEDNHPYISITLSAIMIFMVTLAVYSRKKKIRPIASGIILTILGVVFFVHIYYGERISTGIVANPSTYVMSGPSAGASVVDIIKDGHRIEVIGREDVWLLVWWEGNIAYIKENSLLPLEL